jgi:glyoxylase-like metal-dependent hydrolase (beta-lactamase superfamily II)
MISIKEFYHTQTGTLTYVVWDKQSLDGIVIDPVLDYDATSDTSSEQTITAVISYLQKNNLHLHFVLETHIHADHLSASQVLKREFPEVKIGIGSRIKEVQEAFKTVLGLQENFEVDGSQFDRLFADREKFSAGTIKIEIFHTPGHTPACASYLIDDCVFTGDALFMPDSGTGRCDFPAACASALYASVHEVLYGLPDSTRVFTGHDYRPGGRDVRFVSTIGEEKKSNIHLREETKLEDFKKFRTERDKTLSPPRLLMPSLRVNIAAGRLP